MSRPKAVIFDLGGVLITSPLKAIEEFETENDIPHGYLNYAMFRPLTTSLTVAPPPNPMLGLN
jgi:FMN phosphatase YigB (HAD superfamily)